MAGEAKSAVVLLSGGLDSATALTVAYGQRHAVELAVYPRGRG